MNIIKVGGSLISFPGLAKNLRTLLNQASKPTVIIVGGGEPADLIRKTQTVHNLSDEQCHWLAIKAMSFQTSILSELLPEVPCAYSIKNLHDLIADHEAVLLDANWELREGELGRLVSIGWQSTSDTIAAELARTIQATSLTLVKSVGEYKTYPKSLAEARQLGWVDEKFHEHADGFEIRWVNLRQETEAWPIETK